MTDLLLIDGHSLAYRAFHAVPVEMATASGQVTNAVFGFTNMLISLLRDHQPDRIAVAFDTPGPSFRHEIDVSYKANRTKPPDVFISQLDLIKQVLSALGAAVLESSGVEADDILATLATQARDREISTLLVTGDRDSFQLVEDPFVKVLYTFRGVSNYEIYDEEGIQARTGVKPAKYVMYAALRGDTSDNLPGVAKVGTKTAAGLLVEFGDIDGVYADLQVHPPGRSKALAEAEERVRLNMRMMELRRDVELPVSLDTLDALTLKYDAEAIARIFEFLEFKKLLEPLNEALGTESLPASGAKPLVAAVRTLPSAAQAAICLRNLARCSSPIALRVSTLPSGNTESSSRTDDSPFALALANLGEEEVLWLRSDLLAGEEVLDALGDLLGSDGPPVVAHEAQEIMRSLLRVGLDVRSLSMDTAISAYLLNPSGRRLSVGELLEQHTEFHIAELPEDAPSPEAQQLSLEMGSEPSEGEVRRQQQCALEAYATACLADPLRASLEAAGAEKLHDDIEVPLVRVLARMEHRGIGVDLPGLVELTTKLERRVEKLRKQALEAAGVENVNLNSPKQLGKLLYDHLGLPSGSKTKTGAYSTGARELEKLRGKHPFVGCLMEYREVAKLCSTYGHGLQREVNPNTGRIHATFNQTVARTGRLSSEAPNLHNIPVRTDAGKAFRGVFTATENNELLVADYNQIELRCIAHLAGDPGLLRAFGAGEDVHRATAARIFEVSESDVNYEQRNTAKMVAYGLSYGMEAYGLSQRLNIPTEEAGEILEAYFEAFPGVKKYMADSVAEARARGYTETLFGRRRPIPELHLESGPVRQAAERQAMNAGIQGLAADIFKIALVDIDRALEQGGLESRIILQVHDEVILEVPLEERADAEKLVREAMIGACDLKAPLVVDLSFGKTWLGAKT